MFVARSFLRPSCKTVHSTWKLVLVCTADFVRLVAPFVVSAGLKLRSTGLPRGAEPTANARVSAVTVGPLSRCRDLGKTRFYSVSQ